MHFLIRDMIRVSIAALDAERESVTEVKNTSSAVVSILELALQMVPLEEMELLDQLHGMVLEGRSEGGGLDLWFKVVVVVVVVF